MMKDLATLQQTFQNCVLHTEEKPAVSWVSAGGRAAPEIQISVYSHAYRARLDEVLANDFPALHMAIGDDDFYTLTALYIEAYPSSYFSLREFGRDMPSFILELIENSNDTRSSQWPNVDWSAMGWFYELAIFEWSLGQTFDAEDSDLFTEQDMATIHPEDWPELKFNLHPSVQRLDFNWNAPEMWVALTDDEPKQVNAEKEDKSAWLIWREDFVTRFRSMQKDEQLAFDAMASGQDFNDVCEALSAVMNEEEVPMQAASFLKVWITQGLITSVRM